MSDYECSICQETSWTLVVKGDTEYAEPCPKCKPTAAHAYENGEWTGRKSIVKWFRANDAKRGAQSREENARRAKERVRGSHE